MLRNRDIRNTRNSIKENPSNKEKATPKESKEIQQLDRGTEIPLAEALVRLSLPLPGEIVTTDISKSRQAVGWEPELACRSVGNGCRPGRGRLMCDYRVGRWPTWKRFDREIRSQFEYSMYLLYALDRQRPRVWISLSDMSTSAAHVAAPLRKLCPFHIP